MCIDSTKSTPLIGGNLFGTNRFQRRTGTGARATNRDLPKPTTSFSSHVPGCCVLINGMNVITSGVTELRRCWTRARFDRSTVANVSTPILAILFNKPNASFHQITRCHQQREFCKGGGWRGYSHNVGIKFTLHSRALPLHCERVEL